MTAIVRTKYGPPEALQLQEMEKPAEIVEAFAELERGVHAALEIYSNVHRGSGHNSLRRRRLQTADG